MSYSITLPDNARSEEFAAVAAFFHELADLKESGGILTNVVNVATTEEAAAIRSFVQTVSDAAPKGRVTERRDPYLEGHQPDPAQVFLSGGAAAPSPLPAPTTVDAAVPTPASVSESSATSTAASAEPGAQSTAQAVAAVFASEAPLAVTGAAVPGPSSTIPAPSHVPAAVVTDAGASVGLPAPTVELDSEGFPWNHEIHAESRSKNQDGSWRKKRGVKDEMYESTKQQMRAMMGGATSATVPGPSTIPTASPSAPAQTVPGPATGDTGYDALMMWLNGPMVASPQKLTMADLSKTISDVAPMFGIAEPAGGFNIATIKLAPAPMIAMIRAELGTLAASRGWVEVE